MGEKNKPCLQYKLKKMKWCSRVDCYPSPFYLPNLLRGRGTSPSLPRQTNHQKPKPCFRMDCYLPRFSPSLGVRDYVSERAGLSASTSKAFNQVLLNPQRHRCRSTTCVKIKASMVLVQKKRNRMNSFGAKSPKVTSTRLIALFP